MKELSVGTATAHVVAVLPVQGSLSNPQSSAALCLTAAVLAGSVLCTREALGQTDFMGNALATEDSLTVSFDVGSFNRYIWRGLILTDGPVLQPALTVGRGAWSVNVWGNLDLDEVNGNGSQFNELDITFGWEKTSGPYNFSTGLINYNFPNTAVVTTTELYAGAGFDVPMQPAVTAFFDVEEAQGIYLTFDIAHAFSSDYDEPVEWEFALATGIGWGSSEHNNLYFGSDTDGVTDFHVGLNFAVTIDKKWTLSQSIIYISVVDEQFQGMVATDHSAVYGMALTVEF